MQNPNVSTYLAALEHLVHENESTGVNSYAAMIEQFRRVVV